MGEFTTNTFENEMHLDNAPGSQPDGTARLVRNKRIITTNGSNFSYADIDGTIVSGQVNPKFSPIQALSFLDYMLVYSLNTTLNRGEIGILETPKGSRVGSYTPLYVNDDLNFSLEKTIEGRVIRETESRHIAYWWDNRNSMRFFNTLDPIYTTYIPAGVGVLTIGETYMVLEGVATHNGVDYGPNETDNVFVAINTDYTSTGSKVIDYVPVESLAVIKRTGFSVPRLTGRIVGSLTCGTYYAFYRPTDGQGNGPEWSMPSAPVFINAAPLRINGDGRFLDADMDGGSNDTASPWGATFTIDYIDPLYTKVEVAYMKAIDENTFEDPYLFDSIDVVAGSPTVFNLTVNGGQSFSQEELIRGLLPIVKNKTGAINKNILFISDYEIIADPLYDMSGSATGTTVVKRLPCDETEVDLNATNPTYAAATVDPEFGKGTLTDPLYGVYTTPSAGIDVGQSFQGTGNVGEYYEVVGGTIQLNNSTLGTLSGNFVGPTYFQWLAGYDQWSAVSGSPEVYPVIRIRLYGTEYLHIRVANDYYSNSGMLTNHYVRTGKRTETYRIGIALVDVFGNPKYVHHLFDHTFEEYQTQQLAGSIDLSNNVGGTRQWKHFLNSLGLSISGLDFNLIVDGIKSVYNDPSITLADLPTYFDGFSIVMCKRDKQIIGEGLLLPVTQDTTFGAFVAASHPVANFCYSWERTGNRSFNNFVLRSPELLFNINENPYEVVEGDYLQILAALDLKDPARPNKGTLVNGRTADSRYDYYMKLLKGGFSSYIGHKNYCDPEHCHIYKAAKDVFTFGPSAVNFTYRGGLTGITGGANPFTGTFPVLGNNKNAGAHFITRDDAAGAEFGWPQAHTDVITNKFYPLYAALKKTKNILYGGTGSLAKANNEYFFCGHYQRFDSTFLTYLGGNAGICDGIEIYGFDAFMQLWDHTIAYHNRHASFYIAAGGVHAIIPVQADCLLRFREGRNFAHERINPDVTDGVIFYDDPGTAAPYQPEQFVLNKAYRNTSAWNIPLNAVPYGYIPRRIYDKTVAFSLKKTDGEFRDNLRRFLPGNTLDLESQNGSCTNLYSKQGVLIYIQETSMGYIPVQERVTIANAVGAPVGIGTNDTIDRYEQTNTFHGSRNQFSLVETEDSIYFYDATTQAICRAKINGETVELTTFKGLWGLFREIFMEIPVEDQPLNYKGVVAGYDNENKELLFTFWGLTDKANEPVEYITLAINAINGNMRYFVDMGPRMYVSHNKNLFNISPDHRYPTIQDATAYAEEELRMEEGILYISMAATTTGTPANIAADSNWAVVRAVNQVHAHNRGDVCKFHGLVFPSSISMVLMGKYKREVYFNNYRMDINDSGIKFDTLAIENNRQSGTDTDVATNPDHEMVDSYIEGNYPFDEDGERVTGSFAILTIGKEHATDPVTSNNERAEIKSLDNYSETAY